MDQLQTASLQKIINDFSNALAFFTTAEFLVLCLIVATITMGMRKIIEFFSSLFADKYPKFKLFINNKYVIYFYTEMFLPALPVFIGGIFCEIVTSYPYPQNWKLTGGRVSYGIIAGLLSASVYPRVKYFFKQLQILPADAQKNPLADNQDALKPVVVPEPSIPEPSVVEQTIIPEVKPEVVKVVSEETTKPDIKLDLK